MCSSCKLQAQRNSLDEWTKHKFQLTNLQLEQLKSFKLKALKLQS